ncbi:hypothetical protein HZU75_16770 [Chitinibacter fontanus]|uniref:Uncharacterized protein n=1 Tax=Chitinibacter fontanus TaxID=1737446 RepID=A0A7D5VCR9_9NEIS|nr:hypothetical protein [Chitinibacter fontanus]QLI83040.1 hypothetical protein HZU75_16770 [Chitinibacter fontanus]
MARQLEDTQTLDLLPVPKKRGRPKTGKAMTPAQKQAAYRRRKKLYGIVAIELDRTDVAILLSALRSRRGELERAVSQDLFETPEHLDELCQRLVKLHD